MAGEREEQGGRSDQLMKKFLFLSLLLMIFVGPAYATWMELAGFSVDKTCYTALSARNEVTTDNLSYAYTCNLNLSNKNYGLESVVVNSIEYDNEVLGISYAPFQSVDFGYGLLINDLNTSNYQPAFQQNEDNGLKVDYDTDNFNLEAIGTYQHLYGLKLDGISLYRLNLGFECLSDTKMQSTEGFGRSAVGAYLALPLTDEFSLFAESASSSNGGEGTLAGASFDYDLLVAFSKFSVAAASFNEKFIPGYFTTGYDINPVDFTSLESSSDRRYGTVFTIDTGVMGFIDLYLLNESFNDGGSANSGRLLIIPYDSLMITAFVKEMSFADFRLIKGKDANIVGGSINYKTRFGFSASVNYLKTPGGEDGKPIDTAYMSIGFQF
jgi:hypothetical protein